MAYEIASELKKHLDNLIPNMIISVILYGSYARGDSNKYSDLDILIITKDKIDWLMKDKIYEACSDLNLKYDIWIDVSIIAQNEMDGIKGKQPFVVNALNEGIAV